MPDGIGQGELVHHPTSLSGQHPATHEQGLGFSSWELL